MVEPILGRFAEAVERVEFKLPQVSFLSNVTGTWIQSGEATDPGYWVRHLRSTVRFDAGLRELLAEPERTLLEVGPGRTLAGLARRHPDRQAAHPCSHLALRQAPELAGRLQLGDPQADHGGMYVGMCHGLPLSRSTGTTRLVTSAFGISPAPGHG
jgi:acyl transferase domain-containing protein